MRELETKPSAAVGGRAGDQAQSVRKPVDADRLLALCEALCGMLAAREYGPALALACAHLVHSDHARYAARSSASDRQPGAVVLAGLDAAYAVDAPAPSADRLREIVELAPMALLGWLDGRFHDQPSALDGDRAEWAYGSDVWCYDLPASVRETGGLQIPFERVFVCRRIHFEGYGATEPQHVNADRFTRHWYVFPDTPDLHQRSRVVSVSQPGASFMEACEGIRGRAQIRIYLAEYATEPVFDSRWSPASGNLHWVARGLANEAALIQETRAHMQRAHELNADVVVFPELTVADAGLAAISDWLCDFQADGAAHRISWVVAGSFHVPARGSAAEVENRSVVLDGAGNEIRLSGGDRAPFGAVKMTAVDIEGNGTARIVEANRPGCDISLIHSPLGLQAVAICLDLAQAAYADKVPLGRLPIRWLWVPSMSRVVTAHIQAAQELCRQRLVTTACSNQATALFGDGMALGGMASQSFVWQNEGRHSRDIAEASGHPSWKLATATAR